MGETVAGQAWHESASLETLRALLAAGARVRHVISRRAGLSASELTTLERLSHGSIGPAALARQLDLSTAAATGIVDRLAARGHAERVPDASDRRRTEVHVTASGRAEMLHHLAPMFAGLIELESSFTDEELDVVARYLAGALAAVNAVLDEGAPTAPPAREDA